MHFIQICKRMYSREKELNKINNNNNNIDDEDDDNNNNNNSQKLRDMTN